MKEISEENYKRLAAFIVCIAFGFAFIGNSIGAIVAAAIMQNADKTPYAYAFISAFIGSLIFTLAPKPKK